MYAAPRVLRLCLTKTHLIRQETADSPKKKDPMSIPLDSGWTGDRMAALRLASVWQLSASMRAEIWKRAPDPATWPSLEWLTDVQRQALHVVLDRDVKRDVEMLDQAGIRFLRPGDAEFPSGLSREPDPPFAIFVRGTRLSDGMRVGVVGTRRMTPYGRRATELITGELVRHGVTIVSGLALGIDGAAHAACVEASGQTIAVLPGGIDDISLVPRRHLPLAKRILETNGILLSEHAPGTPVHPYHFLHRNRLIAALSDAVVVVEADHDSGALVTAKLALECGREVLAVPGSLWSPASRGTHALIRQGARLCASADDVFAALGLSNPAHAKQIADVRNTIPMSPEEEHILTGLAEPRTIDELARHLDMPVSIVGALVSSLELKGRIISVGPRTFVKTP